MPDPAGEWQGTRDTFSGDQSVTHEEARCIAREEIRRAMTIRVTGFTLGRGLDGAEPVEGEKCGIGVPTPCLSLPPAVEFGGDSDDAA